MNEMSDIKDTKDVYENFIKSIIEKKSIFHSRLSNTKLFFLPSHSSERIEDLLICFLTDPHEEGYTTKMLTTTNKEIDIELDLLSGSIYEIESYIGIYVGMGKGSNNNKCPYFFIRGKKGLMSWMDGSYEDLKNKENKYPITLLQNVHPKKTSINFKQFVPKPDDIWNHLHKLTDTKIKCIDGEIEVNQYLLSKKSYYFMTYFTKYVNPRMLLDLDLNLCKEKDLPRIDFPKVFIEGYIQYLILKNIEQEKIESNIEEWINFASFIQDFKFVKYLYDTIWNKCDKESQINLNHLIHQHMSIPST
jgi:hypothetical protein